MTDPGKSEVLQGTLDLMILKTLQAHGANLNRNHAVALCLV